MVELSFGTVNDAVTVHITPAIRGTLRVPAHKSLSPVTFVEGFFRLVKHSGFLRTLTTLPVAPRKRPRYCSKVRVPYRPSVVAASVRVDTIGLAISLIKIFAFRASASSMIETRTVERGSAASLCMLSLHLVFGICSQIRSSLRAVLVDDRTTFDVVRGLQDAEAGYAACVLRFTRDCASDHHARGSRARRAGQSCQLQIICLYADFIFVG